MAFVRDTRPPACKIGVTIARRYRPTKHFPYELFAHHIISIAIRNRGRHSMRPPDFESCRIQVRAPHSGSVASRWRQRASDRVGHSGGFLANPGAGIGTLRTKYGGTLYPDGVRVGQCGNYPAQRPRAACRCRRGTFHSALRCTAINRLRHSAVGARSPLRFIAVAACPGAFIRVSGVVAAMGAAGPGLLHRCHSRRHYPLEMAFLKRWNWAATSAARSGCAAYLPHLPLTLGAQTG